MTREIGLGKLGQGSWARQIGSGKLGQANWVREIEFLHNFTFTSRMPPENNTVYTQVDADPVCP
jgi:hypothetical protein